MTTKNEDAAAKLLELGLRYSGSVTGAEFAKAAAMMSLAATLDRAIDMIALTFGNKPSSAS